MRNHSPSLTTPSRSGTRRPRMATALSHAWWPSPLISTTERVPEISSRCRRVGCRSHEAERCPQPMTGPSGQSSSRWVTRPSASSRERQPARSSRWEARVHWPRWTCWSHSPGISQRPSAAYSSAPGGRVSPAPTSTTRPSRTSTSTGPDGATASTPTGTMRAPRTRKPDMAPTLDDPRDEPVSQGGGEQAAGHGHHDVRRAAPRATVDRLHRERRVGGEPAAETGAEQRQLVAVHGSPDQRPEQERSDQVDRQGAPVETAIQAHPDEEAQRRAGSGAQGHEKAGHSSPPARSTRSRSSGSLHRS